MPGWDEWHRRGFVPLLLHGPASLDVRGFTPREQLRESAARLDSLGLAGFWGAGVDAIRDGHEAADWAAAGCTWFRFSLSALLEVRAASYSLDALDDAIVAAEDAGEFEPGWHEMHLPHCEDVALARMAVKFGPALAHTAQLLDVLRITATTLGAAPDVELDISEAADATTPEEMSFLAREFQRRGWEIASVSIAMGRDWPPGSDATLEGTQKLHELADVSARAGLRRLGVPRAFGKIDANLQTVPLPLHLAMGDATRLQRLQQLAERKPKDFRTWLEAAREWFAFAPLAASCSISEEDIRALPDVPDEALVQAFIDEPRGRQLLLATYDGVAPRLNSMLQN